MATLEEKFPISMQLNAELEAAVAAANGDPIETLNGIASSFWSAFMTLEALVRGEPYQWAGRTGTVGVNQDGPIDR